MKLELLFEEVLREMTLREMKLYAPFKLNGEIDVDYIKLIDDLDSLKRYILERKICIKVML